MPVKLIRCVTISKIPNAADTEALLTHYRGMSTAALKDGQSYILPATDGPKFDGTRSQGFSFAAISKSKNKEDMVYYDQECEGHAAMKTSAKSVTRDMVMVYLEVGTADATLLLKL